MRNRVICGFAVLPLLLGLIAQSPSELEGVDQKVKRHFETALPGWKYKRVEPLGNGPNVLIQFWSFANRRVKVSVIAHKSAEEARQVFANHAKYSSDKVALTEIGDEAQASGHRSDVAFRKGRFTVYVTTMANVDADPDAQSLSQAQRVDREKSETARLSRELAKHVARAMDEP